MHRVVNAGGDAEIRCRFVEFIRDDLAIAKAAAQKPRRIHQQNGRRVGEQKTVWFKLVDAIIGIDKLVDQLERGFPRLPIGNE